MEMNPVGWFEIPVSDMARATKFYASVFDFEMSPGRVTDYDMTFFPMRSDLPGAAGALISGYPYTPSSTGTVVYFPVDDIPATLAKVEQHGGKTILQKKPITPHGFIAWFSDTEGNTVALHSRT